MSLKSVKFNKNFISKMKSARSRVDFKKHKNQRILLKKKLIKENKTVFINFLLGIFFNVIRYQNWIYSDFLFFSNELFSLSYILNYQSENMGSLINEELYKLVFFSDAIDKLFVNFYNSFCLFSSCGYLLKNYYYRSFEITKRFFDFPKFNSKFFKYFFFLEKKSVKKDFQWIIKYDEFYFKTDHISFLFFGSNWRFVEFRNISSILLINLWK